MSRRIHRPTWTHTSVNRTASVHLFDTDIVDWVLHTYTVDVEITLDEQLLDHAIAAAVRNKSGRTRRLDGGLYVRITRKTEVQQP